MPACDPAPGRLLVRGANWVGDAVMSLPALAALARNFPAAELTVLTRPWAAAPYAESPVAPRVMLAETSGRHRGLFGRLKLAGELKARRFDLAVLFQNAFEAAALAWLARIPRRLGYARDGRGFLLNPALPPAPGDRRLHETFYYLNILARAGLEAPFSLPRVTVPGRAVQEARTRLAEAGASGGEFLLALAPGAAFGSAKRWPVEHFAEAARLILRERPGRALILGGPGEREAAARLAAALATPHLNLAGQGSLTGSLGFLAAADLLLTNDSGLMHLGGAVGTPLAAVFGPTNPMTTGPLWKNAAVVRGAAPCAPCLARECPLERRICFDQVTPEQVARAALALVTKPAPTGLAPAVFLDRDGTVNREVNYLRRPEDLELLPGAAEAVAALNRAGWKVVVTTNQSGLARGFFTGEELAAIHRRLEELLARAGARLDGLYVCPHHPEGRVPELSVNCACRKPGPGLFEEAARDLGLDLARSVWVGDRWGDVSPSARWGGRGVLVLTGHGLAEARTPPTFTPALVAPDLARAAEWILA